MEQISNRDREVEITAAERMASNPYGWFDESYPTDREAVDHIARGRALEREGKIGKAVMQTVMLVRDTETSDLLRNIDANLDRRNITDFATHYRPRSILFTPDQSTELAEMSRLPGFTPSMLETLQESFPDDSQRLEEFSNLPGFTPIQTSVPTVETFPVHEEDINDWILLRDKTNEEIYQELGGKATSEILGELPNVQGSYGDNVGLRLKEACDQLYNAPKHESRVIAGVGSNVPIKDIERITKTYGGTEEDWTKLSSKKIEYKEGILVPTRIIKIEIHWYENIKTGEKVEAKPKIKNNEWKRK